MTNTVEMALFWLFAAGCLLSGVGVIFLRNAVASAMSLVATFFFLAGIYVLLWSHTIAALQVLVYAGAIMVLFLFVIMLLSLTDSGPTLSLGVGRILGGVGCLGVFLLLEQTFLKLKPDGTVMWGNSVSWASDEARLKAFGTIKQVGEVLYTQWLFPFEAVSLLLLVAIVGAVVVAKPRI